MAPRLSLDHITAWGLETPALIALAARLECEALTLLIESPNAESAGPPFKTDAALRRDTRNRLRDNGIRLQAIECFTLTPDKDVQTFAPGLAAGAEMGGTAATAIIFDPDRARTVDRLGQLVALAASFDVTVNLEFIACSALPSLTEAVSLVRELDDPSVGIVVDSLHWTRSGGTAAELAALDPALLGHVQFCDGPAEMAPDRQLLHEGFRQRMIPGEGTFALADFVSALPPGQLIGVEVPLQDLADQGVPVEERARRAVEASRAFLVAQGYGGQS